MWKKGMGNLMIMWSGARHSNSDTTDPVPPSYIRKVKQNAHTIPCCASFRNFDVTA
jgi:hypothetical protein